MVDCGTKQWGSWGMFVPVDSMTHIWAAVGGPDNDDGAKDGSGGTGVATKTKPKTKKPSMYRVLLLNDDYTPMEFVVHVLERYFNKDAQEATQVMLHVHQKGIGVCGIFPFEIAETKVLQVTDLARKNQHPLQCTMEKV